MKNKTRNYDNKIKKKKIILSILVLSFILTLSSFLLIISPLSKSKDAYNNESIDYALSLSPLDDSNYKITNNSEGINGDSMEFDGHSYMKIPSIGLSNSEIYVSGWFKSYSVKDSNSEITGSWVSNRESFMLFPFTDGSVAFYVYLDGRWIEARSPPTFLQINEWEKWTGTYDGNMIYLYRNDLLVASKQASGTLGSGGDICIGHDCLDEPNNRYFKGLMDEIEIFPNSLSYDEIKSKFAKQFSDLDERKSSDARILVSDDYLINYNFNSGIDDSMELKNGASISDGSLTISDNQYAEIDVNLDSLEQFTLSMWINTESVEKDTQILVEKGNEQIKGWQLSIIKDQLFYFSGAADQPIISDEGVIRPNKWTQVAISWDGENVKMYIDGMNVGSGPATAPDNRASTLLVGARNYRNIPLDGFTGKIDELKIIPKSLYKDDIKSKYESEQNLFY